MTKFVLKQGGGKPEKATTHVQSIVLSNFSYFVRQERRTLKFYTYTKK